MCKYIDICVSAISNEDGIRSLYSKWYLKRKQDNQTWEVLTHTKALLVIHTISPQRKQQCNKYEIYHDVKVDAAGAALDISLASWYAHPEAYRQGECCIIWT